MCIRMTLCVYAHMHAMTHIEIRGQFVEIVFSFSYMGPRDQTQVVRLRSNFLYPLSHLASPSPASCVGFGDIASAGLQVRGLPGFALES